jgi:hypothetical protein
LIVGLMGEDYAEQVFAGDGAAEEFDAEGAETGGEIFREGFHPRLDLVSAGNCDGDFELPAQVSDEIGIAGAGLAAGLMIEVDDVEREIGVGVEEMEKGDAVGTATDGDGPAAGRDFRGGGNHADSLHGKSPRRGPWALERCPRFSGKSI